MIQNNPVVLITCNTHVPADGIPLHLANDKYLQAISERRNAIPILLPNTLSDSVRLTQLIESVDGLLLTGSLTMVNPQLYGAQAPSGMRLNKARDAAVLRAVDAAIQSDVPILAICRGIQELNVALGGTLQEFQADSKVACTHQAHVTDHRASKYTPSHPVRCSKDGMLWSLASEKGLEPEHILVNSLHRQAIDRLGRDLVVEAVALDGVIEAVSLNTPTDCFVLGVQWHAEWETAGSLSQCIFDAFVKACQERADHKN